MCDIWTANAQGRELPEEELDRHVAALDRLHVQRVMLTGGEPLLHRNLWNFCARVRDRGCRITLVTTGLLLDKHVHDVAAFVDELVVSVDGEPQVHDEIRRVPNGFARIARGLDLLSNHTVRPHVVARCVVQRLNCARVAQTVAAVRALPVDHLSFLAADVTSTAFNRALPWDAARQGEVALSLDQLSLLAASVAEVESRCRRELDELFIVGGMGGLRRILDYYRALAGQGVFPVTRCNAPWISAVVEADGTVRPCFFHQPYATGAPGLETALNSPQAIAFRKSLSVHTDETCRRCVCTIARSPWDTV
jgi:MoaA/NifB/PqqE/SkfB family radical SAM enzyme